MYIRAREFLSSIYLSTTVIFSGFYLKLDIQITEGGVPVWKNNTFKSGVSGIQSGSSSGTAIVSSFILYFAPLIDCNPEFHCGIRKLFFFGHWYPRRFRLRAKRNKGYSNSMSQCCPNNHESKVCLIGKSYKVFGGVVVALIVNVAIEVKLIAYFRLVRVGHSK